jgi:hypothetical protein
MSASKEQTLWHTAGVDMGWLQRRAAALHVSTALGFLGKFLGFCKILLGTGHRPGLGCVLVRVNRAREAGNC